MKSLKKILIGFIIAIPLVFLFQNCKKMESQVLSTTNLSLLATASTDVFSLSCDGNGPVITLAQKSTGTISCSVGTTNGFSGNLTMSIHNLPTGVTASPFTSTIEIPAIPIENVSEPLTVPIPVAINVNQATLGLQSFKISLRSADGKTATIDQRLNVVSNVNRVNVLYLIPSDRTEKATKEIELAVRYLQIWYGKQNNGKTFTLSYPVVRVARTTHPASWYSTNPTVGSPQQFWFFNNVSQDAYALAGVTQSQPNDTWLIYVDAAPATSPVVQTSGSASGIAVLHSKDIQSVMGLDAEWKRCRGIGGSGHELGHAFFLPQTASGSAATELMGTGFNAFPNATFTSAELATLNSRGFFQSTSGLTQKDFDCSVEAP